MLGFFFVEGGLELKLNAHNVERKLGEKRNNERHSKIFILDILKTCTIQLGSHLSVKILSHTDKSHARLCPHTTGIKSSGKQLNTEIKFGSRIKMCVVKTIF